MSYLYYKTNVTYILFWIHFYNNDSYYYFTLQNITITVSSHSFVTWYRKWKVRCSISMKVNVAWNIIQNHCYSKFQKWFTLQIRNEMVGIRRDHALPLSLKRSIRSNRKNTNGIIVIHHWITFVIVQWRNRSRYQKHQIHIFNFFLIELTSLRFFFLEELERLEFTRWNVESNLVRASFWQLTTSDDFSTSIHLAQADF